MDKTTIAATVGELRALLLKSDTAAAKNGALTARERITGLFDEGTFTETGTFTARRVTEFDSTLPDELESVICGYGSVNGCLVYAFAQDIARAKGSVSEAAAKKICAVYKLAVENGCPVVGIFDSAGAYLPEGVRALAGYGSIMKAVSQASGVIPQIALCAGVVQGAAAVIASMFDLVLVTEGSKISVNPPFIVGGGTAEDAAENGIAAYTAGTDAEALGAVREILSYLPSNNEEGGVEILTNDEVNRHIVPAFDDVRSLVASFADDGKYLELYAGYAKVLSVGLISLAGVVCGVVGTNHAEDGGRLTSAAARKAAKFISFCDCFQIPVITLVDSEGFVLSGNEEKNPFCAEIGKLAGAYAMAKTPLITFVSGSAYGSVFSVLGSKSIGADIVFALDTAKISCLNAKSAVALLWNDQIDKNTSREALETKWNEEIAAPVAAARAGEIDDIIEPAEIRQRLASAVMMLAGKSAVSPRRRHANLPL
ncbi:MAG: carboxyl transferase domain-containing protein [Eubacteriales bacterium]